MQSRLIALGCLIAIPVLSLLVFSLASNAQQSIVWISLEDAVRQASSVMDPIRESRELMIDQAAADIEWHKRMGLPQIRMEVDFKGRVALILSTDLLDHHQKKTQRRALDKRLDAAILEDVTAKREKELAVYHAAMVELGFSWIDQFISDVVERADTNIPGYYGQSLKEDLIPRKREIEWKLFLVRYDLGVMLGYPEGTLVRIRPEALPDVSEFDGMDTNAFIEKYRQVVSETPAAQSRILRHEAAELEMGMNRNDTFRVYATYRMESREAELTHVAAINVDLGGNLLGDWLRGSVAGSHNVFPNENSPNVTGSLELNRYSRPQLIREIETNDADIWRNALELFLRVRTGAMRVEEGRFKAQAHYEPIDMIFLIPEQIQYAVNDVINIMYSLISYAQDVASLKSLLGIEIISYGD